VVEDSTRCSARARGAGVGDLLKPLLARGEIRILATTTPEGVRKINERDLGAAPLLDDHARRALVEQAIEILRGIATRYEKHHRVRIGEGAIVAAVTLAKRYLSDRALPDTAVDLLDETAARKRVEVDGVPAEVDALRRAESLARRSRLAGRRRQAQRRRPASGSRRSSASSSPRWPRCAQADERGAASPPPCTPLRKKS
jgi:ATP-dependent Clp protease ATP-binding subunit ClpA